MFPTRSSRDYLFVFGAGVLVIGTLLFITLTWSFPHLVSTPAEIVVSHPTTTIPLHDPEVVCNDPPTSTAANTDVIPSNVATSTDIHLLFVGDIMLDRNVANRSHAAHDLGYPFRKLPENWLASFDYTVANLEGPVTPIRRPPEKSIDFQFDPAVVPVLKEQGFDAFSQANNHALDQGSQGYSDSVTSLREAGFLVFGHQVQDDDIALATTTIKGKTFAFVGWNTTDNPIDLDAAAQVLTKARAEADYVIAFMHWGAEYQNHPLLSVVTLANWLVAHGVDVVMGGHPHWVQGMSQSQGHPIIYSMGNFIFDQDFSEETTQGLAVGLTFHDRTVEVQPIPLSVKSSQPRVVVKDERTKRLDMLAVISDAEFVPSIKAGSIRFSLDPVSP